MASKPVIIVDDKKLSTRFMGILLVLAIFIFIFFPFYGLTLRYYIGSIVSKIMNFLGTLCLFGGIIITAIALIGIFAGGFINTKWMILGIVLLWIGCWCNNTVLEFNIGIFNFIFGDSDAPDSGYHIRNEFLSKPLLNLFL